MKTTTFECDRCQMTGETKADSMISGWSYLSVTLTYSFSRSVIHFHLCKNCTDENKRLSEKVNSTPSGSSSIEDIFRDFILEVINNEQ